MGFPGHSTVKGSEHLHHDSLDDTALKLARPFVCPPFSGLLVTWTRLPPMPQDQAHSHWLQELPLALPGLLGTPAHLGGSLYSNHEPGRLQEPLSSLFYFAV